MKYILIGMMKVVIYMSLIKPIHYISIGIKQSLHLSRYFSMLTPSNEIKRIGLCSIKYKQESLSDLILSLMWEEFLDGCGINMVMVAFDVLLHAGYESGLLVALKEGHNALDGRWRNNVVRVFQRLDPGQP